MEIYNLVENCNNYLKPFVSLCKYHKDEPALHNNENYRILNFWRTLEMSLIICKTNLVLTWSKDFVFSSGNGKTKFKITDTKLYVPAVTLSTQYNTKLV